MRPAGLKEIDRLDHIVTVHIKTTKYQLNDTIYNEPMFDTNSFNLSRGTEDPLPVVTVSL